MRVEARLAELGLTLPETMRVPPGMELPFEQVRIRGHRAYVSGHGPLNPDGTARGPVGKVGDTVSVEEAHELARLTALAVLGDLKRALGDLDRVTAWLHVRGLVNAHPEFTQTSRVINGFSDLILDVFGPEVGAHARTTMGVATLAWNVAVIVEAEVEIDAE